MRVEANQIFYADHVVVCDPKIYESCPEYVSEMAETLSPDGDARKHAKELRYMNNDGTWGLKKLPA